MNQPLTPTNASLPRLSQKVGAIALIALSLLALLLMGMYPFKPANPYIDRVLALKGDPVQGHAIFQMNCATCHGLYGDGKVGPSLKNVATRRSQSSLIEQVISGNTPPMPQFQPSPETMADLLQYLNTL